MKKSIIRPIRRRFFEFVFLEVFFSVIVTALGNADSEINHTLLTAMSIWSVIIYLIINMFQQKRCCCELIDKRAYYKINCIAYSLFMILNLLLSVVMGSVSYSWLFSITGFISYVYEPMPVEISAVIFHVLNFINIFVSVLGMEQTLRTLKNNTIRDEDDY